MDEDGVLLLVKEIAALAPDLVEPLTLEAELEVVTGVDQPDLNTEPAEVDEVSESVLILRALPFSSKAWICSMSLLTLTTLPR